VPLRDAHPDYFVPSDDEAGDDGDEPPPSPSHSVSLTPSVEAAEVRTAQGQRLGSEAPPTGRRARRQLNAREAHLDGLFGLGDRVAIVTGASGSIGEALARGLAAAGANVALVARRAQPLEDLAGSIQSAGGTAFAFPADVLDRVALEAIRREISTRFGRLDILVNAAGGNVPEATLPEGGSFFELPTAAFERVVSLNLMGTVLPTQVFGAAMADRKPEEASGSIVNISSMAADRAVTRVAGYAVAKAGVNSLTRWLAAAAAQAYGDRLRVNAIAPGFFLGAQNQALLLTPSGEPTARAKAVIEHTPARRLGDPAELVSAVIWLCGPGASFVTGAVVPVDGGFGAFSGV
jgi:NAD(P)-dependent dehydrogenase (short-subunit alcohol dehydrogenase family)